MTNETETEIFDRETILDLVVNFIPLFIIFFFIVAFLLFNPFGVEPLASGIQFGLLVAPFVLLAILTYISGKAISGAEKGFTVYLPGQATVTGAKPLHGEDESGDPELESGGYLATEDDGDDETDETDA
jgi:hypothetical protein